VGAGGGRREVTQAGKVPGMSDQERTEAEELRSAEITAGDDPGDCRAVNVVALGRTVQRPPARLRERNARRPDGS